MALLLLEKQKAHLIPWGVETTAHPEFSGPIVSMAWFWWVGSKLVLDVLGMGKTCVLGLLNR